VRRPAVFVSSTCYDLRQLRADLRAYLENAGFEPVLSEYPTFPVDPGAATIANSRKAVESRADIFVLIIGNRYGSTDEHGKSVTNLEYLTARAKGIPIYVFAMRSIIDLLPVWDANPGADFKNVVDSPSLFEFVSGIRSSGKTWVFPFDLAEDIVSTLRIQLAYLFADALELRMRVATSGLNITRYKDVSGAELRVMIDRPPAWEYSLFTEALLREIAQCADLKRDWSHRIAIGSKQMKRAPFLSYLSEKMAEATGMFSHLETLFHSAFEEAVGPPGQAGDPEKILYVASRIGALYHAALEWKIDFYRVLVDEPAVRLRDIVASMLDNAVSEVEEFATSTHKRLADAITASKQAPILLEANLQLTFNPLMMDELSKETKRLEKVNWE